jgi:hypothetical protein
LLWNNAGVNAGASTVTYDGSILTTSGRFINSYNATASSPAKAFTGTWFTGGTGTTTKPQVLIEPTGATSTAWSTSGTGLGVNAASGFSGNLLDLQVNGTSQIAVSNSGALTFSNKTSGNYIAFGSTSNLAVGGGGSLIGFTTGIFFADGGMRSPSYSLQNFGGSQSTNLIIDGNNTVAQRNGTNAQTSRIYGTYTDASNYERLSTTWSSNVCYTKPENAGTGSARLYVPVTGATTVSGLPAAATAGAGARAFVTDANATTFLSTVAGGGANKVPVVSDGTNWLIG